MDRLSKLVVPALALSSVLMFGCGSSSKAGGAGGAGGSTGGGAFNPGNLICTSSMSQTANCTAAELAPFENCFIANCGTGLQTCYGPGYMTGDFSGACGTYAACINKCSCSDSACRTACGTQPTACSSCVSTSLTACGLACLAQLPACALGGTGQGGAAGGLGGAAGGLGGASGETTCLVQLATCCAAAATTTLQSGCAAEAQDLLSMGALAETSCGVKLAGLKAMYCP